jgi:hypothetical protein
LQSGDAKAVVLILTLAGATAAFFRSIAILNVFVCVKGQVTKLRRSYLLQGELELISAEQGLRSVRP